MNSADFKVVIPARYASTRLPGKPLRLLAGRPMLQHVCERAAESAAGEIIIATDDQRIADAAATFGVTACMTSPAHTSGTERLAEVAALMGWNDATLVVNLQGDEPAMPAAFIDQVAADLHVHPRAAITTLACPLESTANELNPHIVKVVLDRDGYALYFSRAPIPWHRDELADLPGKSSVAPVLHHIGLYAYRAGFLKQFVALKPSPLEEFEKLEQLRALWHGEKIHVGVTRHAPASGVDTEEDLLRVEKLLKD